MAFFIFMLFSPDVTAGIKRSMTCRGDLLIMDTTWRLNPIYDPKKTSSSAITEDQDSIKVAFEKHRDLVRVSPWRGISWTKLAFAYNQDVRFSFKSDGQTWFTVEADYQGQSKQLRCTRRSHNHIF